MKFLLNAGFFLFMIPFLVGCSSFGYQSPRYIKLAHKITSETGKQLKAQKNLYLVGTGGQMMDDIQMMAMSFYYYQEVNLKTARELVVYVVREYLSSINGNKEIRPYLHEYPFTAKNVEIRIFVYNPDGSELPSDKIYCMECIDGQIKYYTRSDYWNPMLEETYEEALKAVSECSEKVTTSEVTAKDGAKVNIKVSNLEYSMFEMNGEGFKPYEFLNITSNSYDEVLYFRVRADENGSILPVGLAPAVIGKSGGICYIDIWREEGAMHVKLPWGTEKLKTGQLLE